MECGHPGLRLQRPMTEARAPPLEVAECESRPYDCTQELRAMILAALPYPPLPVILRRIEDGNRLGADVLQTSHDILSKLLSESCVRCTVSENADRREKQRGILREFLAELVKDGLQAPPKLYHTLCQFTMKHIESYFREGSPAPQIRFMPFDEVCKGDVVHKKMCDYIAAQARLLELQGGLCAQDWMDAEYFQLMLVARDRLVCEGKEERELQEEESEK